MASSFFPLFFFSVKYIAAMPIIFEYDYDFIESDSCNRFIGPKDMNYFEDFFFFLSGAA